jgi:hypothetical protein
MVKKYNYYKLPPFVAMTRELLNSKAYINLPPSAAKILPRFLDKVRCGYNDPARYQTTFVFPYSEATRLGFGKTTFYNILKDLMQYGFIDPVRKGGLRSYGLTKNIFKLSKRWERYEYADFHEIKWECFQSQVPFVKPIGINNGIIKGELLTNTTQLRVVGANMR